MFDDIINIVKNESVSDPRPGFDGLIEATWSGESGPLKRPIAYLSFALNVMNAGETLETFSFKLTNVLIHAINALLVFGLAKKILRLSSNGQFFTSGFKNLWLPLAAAALWALHPLQVTAVLHIVQRMTLLSASFVLLGTLLYLTGRDQLLSRPRKGWILMGAGLGTGLLGLLAKENAVLMPFLLLSIEYTLYSNQPLNHQLSYRLRIFYLAVVGIPLLLALGLLFVYPDFITSTYAARDFGPGERLLTQARAIWFYLGLIAVPDLTTLTLFHDDFPLSRGLLEPWTTFPAVIGILLLIVAAVLLRRRSSLLSLAILWFLVGHSLESTVIGLELVYEHRNYLPGMITFIAIAGGLGAAFHQKALAISTCLILTISLMSATFLRSQTWSQEDTLIESMVRHHPRSARSQAMMGEFLAYRQRDLENALPHYRSAISLAPSNTAFAIQMVLATAQFTTSEQPPQPVVLPDLPELSAHISKQLAAKRPNFSTLDALDTTVNCVVEIPHHCRELYLHVLRWCLAILDDPRISSDMRLFATDRVLTLTIWNGEYRRALEIITRARQAEPENDYYSLLAADVHYRSGDLDEAERHVRSVRDDYPVRGLRKKKEQLLSSIATARNHNR